MLKKGCGCLFGLLLICALVVAAIFTAASNSSPTQSIDQSTNVSPGETIDLFTKVGQIQDGTITKHCYVFSRVGNKDEIIEQSKALVKRMNPGRDVAYIFNVKNGVDEFIASEQNGLEWSPRIQKFMRESHFAHIAYMGDRWELMQTNEVANRKFRNKMEPIPLSAER